MRITKVYTKTGDQGETSLVGGQRVAKDHPRVEAYGTVDELASAIGWARAELARGAETLDGRNRDQLDSQLDYIQNQLFDLGAVLATPPGPQANGRISQRSVAYLEELIDSYNQTLPALQDFVLPGGSVPVAALHLARCVARRAERCVITLSRFEPLQGIEAIYLNRLSDLLFVLARWVALRTGAAQPIWRHELPEPQAAV